MQSRMATALAGLALLAVSCSGSTGETTVSTAEDGLLQIVAYDRQDFDADLYEAKAGEVKFELLLDGFQVHTLVVEGLEDYLRLEVGDQDADFGSVNLQPGRYILYCDIAGHRSSGMEARLVVS